MIEVPGLTLTSQTQNGRLDQTGNGDSILETPLSVGSSSVKLSEPLKTPPGESVEAAPLPSADLSKESNEGSPSMIVNGDSNTRPYLVSSRSVPSLLEKSQDTSQPPLQTQRSLDRASSGTNLRAAFATQRHPSSHRLLKPDESTPIVRQPSRRRLMMMERANSAPNLFDKGDHENGESNENNNSNRRRRGQLSKDNNGSKSYTVRNTSRKSPTRTRRTGRRRAQSPKEVPSREEDPATYSSRRQVSSRSASCRTLSDTAPVSPGRRNLYASNKSRSAGSIHSTSSGRAPRRMDLLARSQSSSLKSCGDNSLLNAKRPRRTPTNEEKSQEDATVKKNGNNAVSSNSTAVGRWENPKGVHRRTSMDNASVASRPRRGSINSINSASSNLSRWDNPEGAHRRCSMNNASVPRRPSMADDNSPRAPSRASSPTEHDAANNNDNNDPGMQRKGTAVTSNRSFKSAVSRDLPSARPRRTREDDYDDKLPTTIITVTGPSRKPTSTYRLSNDTDLEQDDRRETDSLLGYADMEDMLESKRDKFLPRNSNRRRSKRHGSMSSQASFGSFGSFGSFASRRSRNSIGSFYSTSGASAAAQFQSRRVSMGGRQLPTRAKSHCDGATRGGPRIAKKRALRTSTSVDTTLGIMPRNVSTGRCHSPHQEQQRRHSGAHQQHMNSFAGVVLGRHSHSFRLRRAPLSQSDHQVRDRQKFRRSRSMDIKPSVIRRAPSPPTVGDNEDGVSVASLSCDISGVISALDLEDDQDMTLFTTNSNGSNSSDDLTNSLRSGSLATRSFKSTRSYHSTGSRLSCSSSRKSFGSKKSNCSPLPVATTVAKKPPANIADLVENMESEGEYVIFIGDKKDLARVKGPDDDGDSDDGDDNSTYISGGAISLAPSTGSRGSFHNTSLTNMDTSGLTLGTFGDLDDSENSDGNHERNRSASDINDANDANIKANEGHTVGNKGNVNSNVDREGDSADSREEAAGSEMIGETGEDNNILAAVTEKLGDEEAEDPNNSDDEVQGEVEAEDSNNEDQDVSSSSSSSGSSSSSSSSSGSSSSRSSSDSNASESEIRA